MSLNCPDCFKDVRSMRDVLNQTRIDAQKHSNKEQIKVAIIYEGVGYRFEEIKGVLPEGTVEIINPGQ